jgi:hypothetical protein
VHSPKGQIKFLIKSLQPQLENFKRVVNGDLKLPLCLIHHKVDKLAIIACKIG